MLYRIKRVITDHTLSGSFAILAIMTANGFWYVSAVLLGIASVFWWNPKVAGDKLDD